MVRWEERVTDQAARSLEKSEVERREEREEKERQLLWQVQEPVKPQGQTGAKLLLKDNHCIMLNPMVTNRDCYRGY